MRTLLLALLMLISAGAETPLRPRVALDAGHGGEDHGARGRKGLKEKDAALALAQEVRRQLEAKGVDVVMVRQEDVQVPLLERAHVANKAEAKLFVSLHFNANKGRSGRGSEVYFLSLDQGDADAQAVAESENAGTPAGSAAADPVSAILDDLAQQAFLVESQRLAVEIQQQLNRVGGIRQRGVKQAPFAVLRRAAMPAVLVEAAFISNPVEEAKLRRPEFRKKLAEAIVRGVQHYLAGGGTVKRKAFQDR